jgi:hypothetical protein
MSGDAQPAPTPLPPRRPTAEEELERVRKAVERHRSDRSPGADARLYAAVLSQPLEAAVDNRVDDPNDWPAP